MSDTERLELLKKLDRAGSRLRMLLWLLFALCMTFVWLFVLGFFRFGIESIFIAPIAGIVTTLFCFDYIFGPIDGFYECLRAIIAKPGDPQPPVMPYSK